MRILLNKNKVLASVLRASFVSVLAISAGMSVAVQQMRKMHLIFRFQAARPLPVITVSAASPCRIKTSPFKAVSQPLTLAAFMSMPGDRRLSSSQAPKPRLI